jgi:hypothetical protein
VWAGLWNTFSLTTGNQVNWNFSNWVSMEHPTLAGLEHLETDNIVLRFSGGASCTATSVTPVGEVGGTTAIDILFEDVSVHGATITVKLLSVRLQYGMLSGSLELEVHSGSSTHNATSFSDITFKLSAHNIDMPLGTELMLGFNEPFSVGESARLQIDAEINAGSSGYYNEDYSPIMRYVRGRLALEATSGEYEVLQKTMMLSDGSGGFGTIGINDLLPCDVSLSWSDAQTLHIVFMDNGGGGYGYGYGTVMGFEAIECSQLLKTEVQP